MNEPLRLDPKDFFDFIARPEPAVLFLSVHSAHSFNPRLCECFDDGKVAFGRLPLLDLFDSVRPALSFLRGEIVACGASVPMAVPPGYYLFQNGRMLAWDSGLPAAGDGKRIIRGSLVGAAVSLFTRNLKFVSMAIQFAAETAAAERVAIRFQRAAADHRENPRKSSAYSGSTSDDLANAYRVLQVEPTASDDEVNQAWRELMQKYHPDRAARDSDEFERLSRICVEFNRARDTIRYHRRHAHRHAASE